MRFVFDDGPFLRYSLFIISSASSNTTAKAIQHLIRSYHSNPPYQSRVTWGLATQVMLW